MKISIKKQEQQYTLFQLMESAMKTTDEILGVYYKTVSEDAPSSEKCKNELSYDTDHQFFTLFQKKLATD